MADALHQLCVEGVVSILQGLGLPGIGSNVFPQLLFEEANLPCPYLRVSVEGEAETVGPFTTCARLWVLPVRVEMVDRLAGPAEEKRADWLLIRQAILDAFGPLRPPGFPDEV